MSIHKIVHNLIHKTNKCICRITKLTMTEVIRYYSCAETEYSLCIFVLTFNELCAWRHKKTICLRPLQVDNIFAFARWHLFRHVGYLRHEQQVDLWPFDLESGVRITCDVGYLCANFSLPRPLCSRVRPDVRDRQTDVKRQTKVSLA